MSPKTPRPHSLALLPHLPLTFTSQVHLLPFHQPRLLTLRGPLLILSKSTSPTPRIHLVTPSNPPRPSSTSTTQILLPNLRISFPDSTTRLHFLHAVTLLFSRLSPGLPHYHIRHPIGRGSEALVYLVQRRSDAALFAMKTVAKDHAFLTHSRLQSVVAERVALVHAAKRQCPFIVRLVDAFETHTHLCFVTRWAEHGDLSSVMARLSPRAFSEPVARCLFVEALLALEDCHRMGYLFRDIKLANLVLDKHGHVRLIDFGLAKRLRLSDQPATTPRSSVDSIDPVQHDTAFRLVGRTKSFVGTRRYMSPEHLTATQGTHRGYGVEADIWALAITLYVMLTGHYPFAPSAPSRDAAAVFRAIATEKLTFPRTLGHDVRALLSGMLQRDPKRRLGLSEIKAHRWLKGVDWHRVRAEAAADVDQKIVLDELRANGIVYEEGRAQGDGEHLDWSIIRCSIGSSVSCDSLDSRASFRASLRKGKGAAANPDLLGFSYVDWGRFR